jgi:hypothetical protein
MIPAYWWVVGGIFGLVILGVVLAGLLGLRSTVRGADDFSEPDIGPDE